MQHPKLQTSLMRSPTNAPCGLYSECEHITAIRQSVEGIRDGVQEIRDAIVGTVDTVGLIPKVDDLCQWKKETVESQKETQKTWKSWRMSILGYVVCGILTFLGGVLVAGAKTTMATRQATPVTSSTMR